MEVKCVNKSKKSSKKSSKHKPKLDKQQKELVNKLKHVDVFYEAPPPGLVKQVDEKPEDCIPDLPENQDARDFLAKAPSKGLWMPLGKEVKVMKCWRCKRYGHRTGDKECPMFISGNEQTESFRAVHEDPMYEYVQESKRLRKEDRIKRLQSLLEESDSSEGDGGGDAGKRKKGKRRHSSSSGSSSSSSSEPCSRHRKKKSSRKKHRSSKKHKRSSKQRK
ncbi:PREDICTED: retinitis pigmentosa 9 protein-like [Priapulus caudatus]|uniref:Retinitis pigmentosa 9 protein-like n=1 Tax=Priapulus caudatus TaxID=37621 RepID=A0ABM1EKC6_PRICU|nr:PREDICTED: retinitis pigmentosa 9 protein-like [Priapulus caudatus]